MSITCKVILIGESGVGKTCIIKRFVSNEFNSSQHSTLGVSHSSKTIKFPKYHKSIDFQLWDTAGQEQYRGIQRLFYKESKIVIFVYDITNHRTFTEIRDFWYNQAKQYSSENISK
jgi:small GTP-binding protein